MMQTVQFFKHVYNYRSNTISQIQCYKTDIIFYSYEFTVTDSL